MVAATCAMLVLQMTAARSAEFVNLPYQCKLERGRVALIPSPERSYELIGVRKQQSFLFCAAHDESRCRLRMLHRFEIMCGTAKTSWVDVAVALTRLSGREAWIEAERLNVVIGPGAKPASSDCVDTPWPLANERPCRVRSERLVSRVVSMPPGFAPVTELGARLTLHPIKSPVPLPAPTAGIPSPASTPQSAVLAAAMPSPTVAHSATSAQPQAAAPPPAQSQQVSSGGTGSGTGPRLAIIGPDSDFPIVPVVAKDPPLELLAGASKSQDTFRPEPAPAISVTTEPAPSTAVATDAPPPAPSEGSQRPIEVADARPRPITVAQSWSVTVHERDGEASAGSLAYANGLTGASTPLFFIALLTVSLAGVGLLIRRSGRPGDDPTSGFRDVYGASELVVRRRSGLLSLEDPDERVLVDLRRTADQLRINAEAMLDELKSAPPLRGVLRQELDFISLRLSDAQRVGGGPVTARQMRQRFQGGIRELHRVIKIAEGAAASFSSTAPRPKVPTNRDEAYDLLGVNDSVSDATLKKVVDALRMSWHPDYARDEDDRSRREERTKQINVTWDLITKKRTSG